MREIVRKVWRLVAVQVGLGRVLFDAGLHVGSITLSERRSLFFVPGWARYWEYQRGRDAERKPRAKYSRQLLRNRRQNIGRSIGVYRGGLTNTSCCCSISAPWSAIFPLVAAIACWFDFTCRTTDRPFLDGNPLASLHCTRDPSLSRWSKRRQADRCCCLSVVVVGGSGERRCR